MTAQSLYALPVERCSPLRRGPKTAGTANVEISFPKAWQSIHTKAYQISTRRIIPGGKHLATAGKGKKN